MAETKDTVLYTWRYSRDGIASDPVDAPTATDACLILGCKQSELQQIMNASWVWWV